MKIAFVYDRVTKFGGAERVLKALHDIWPDAPVYTAFYYPDGAPWSRGWNIRPSFLQSIPFASRRHEWFPWATPVAFETFNFDQFDVVISVTSAEAKTVITKPKTLHICYCLTPTRYLWSHADIYAQHPDSPILKDFISGLFQKILPILRSWDLISARRPDTYVAISHHVQKRIESFYGITCDTVIYPPVDTAFFKPPTTENNENYFLLVSRAVYYKRLDMVIRAFGKIHLPLVVISQGLGLKKLKQKAKPNIQFISRYLTDTELLGYYQNCRAFVYAGEEDFGLVALEAQSCGKPVIAYRHSGISEIVRDNTTGILYGKQSEEDLIQAVYKFQRSLFSVNSCRKNAERFSLLKFSQTMKNTVESMYKGNKHI